MAPCFCLWRAVDSYPVLPFRPRILRTFRKAIPLSVLCHRGDLLSCDLHRAVLLRNPVGFFVLLLLPTRPFVPVVLPVVGRNGGLQPLCASQDPSPQLGPEAKSDQIFLFGYGHWLVGCLV